MEFENNYAKFLSMTEGKKRMLGCYIFDYPNVKEMEVKNMEYQLERYLKSLQAGETEGIIFCSNALMDTGFEAVEYVREWLKKNEHE